MKRLTERLLSVRSGVDGYKLKTGISLGYREMNQLIGAWNELREAAPIFIDDTPRNDVLQIARTAPRLRSRHGIGLIIVDYLTLLGASGGAETREEHIAGAVRELKALARELRVPVIALSQVGRSVECREDRRPYLADLRGSGAIEEDADVVLLLHRPDYYDAKDQPGIAELTIAKNRDGYTGLLRFQFLRTVPRFENLPVVGAPSAKAALPEREGVVIESV